MPPSDSSGSLPGDLATRTKQQTTSRMMKTTRRGRPFAKDTHDLFATLIVSLELGTHRQYFKTYHNSFTTDEAAENLSHLKFSQSNRVPDPNEPSRVVTTTTTTTFSMNRDMAKGICQHFMDARLIENAGDATNPIFKDKGVYMLTPKGLHILERFITKNGINGDHLLKVFSSQPICMKLLHLERRATDDELLINTPVLEVIFRRFVGRAPNYETAPKSEHGEGGVDRTLGVEMADVQEKVKGQGQRTVKQAFNSMGALDWLCDFTTVCGKDEAAEVMAHFQRLDFIRLVLDKSKREVEPYDDRDVILRVEDGRGGVSEGHYRCHSKTLYGVSDKGRQVARWDGSDSPASGTASPARDESLRLGDESASMRSAKQESTSAARETGSPGSKDSRLASKPSTKLRNERASTPASGGAAGIGQGLHDSSSYSSRDSNTNRLKNILDEPALRSLFREFLRQNFCEENLSFWLDVQDFKRRFHTTSSAVAVQTPSKEHKSGVGRRLGRSVTGALAGGQKDRTEDDNQGLSAMEKHQQDLVSMAFVIYDTYLAPSSPCELNIDHNLRTELILYMNKILADAKLTSYPSHIASPSTSTLHLSSSTAGSDANVGHAGEPTSIEERKAAVVSKRLRIPLHASQLQVMVRLYERIQDYIFRLMATDSVPRFIKDARFIQLVRSVEEYTEALAAGRIDPEQNAGPAVGRAVFEAMQLGSADMLAQNSNDGRPSMDAGSYRPLSAPQKPASKGVPAVPSIPAQILHDRNASAGTKSSSHDR
ncbi:Regulator of G protein signaling domain protein [Kalmanozyma brasiliensis GHG001]|uniref:Putative Regulator of G-Protein Signaling Protein n=1 Tax=Kalmanozyma brasiliensis (strain GHG001) TaxID=1365824 RepID=V5EP74_KALBG|nr:Regulator of G protein signaling domain protein [Kalmanozyma brasiliensis GHG001]EST04728.1 Regulator of G protein signaling domain protein [Kalmanozyma brasiliensis GHG001]